MTTLIEQIKTKNLESLDGLNRVAIELLKKEIGEYFVEFIELDWDMSVKAFIDMFFDFDNNEFVDFDLTQFYILT